MSSWQLMLPRTRVFVGVISERLSHWGKMTPGSTGPVSSEEWGQTDTEGLEITRSHQKPQ